MRILEFGSLFVETGEICIVRKCHKS